MDDLFFLKFGEYSSHLAVKLCCPIGSHWWHSPGLHKMNRFHYLFQLVMLVEQNILLSQTDIHCGSSFPTPSKKLNR